MGKIYLAPEKIVINDNHVVFLAGSIEGDLAEKWQIEIADELVKIPNLTILNPRRAKWDNSWKQVMSNPQFKEQVDWELAGIEKADTILFYFDQNTKSPITLLELGIVSQRISKVFVCCPDGFYRKGNVDIVCDRYGMDSVHSLDELKFAAYEYLNSLLNGRSR